MTLSLISLRGIHKVFGKTPSTEVRALDGIDLDIDEGEFVAITGPSGGGKSTLLSILGLLDTPSSGSYTLDGTDTNGLSDRQLTALRSRRFGFVFQSFHLLGPRAVRDSVELGLLYQGADQALRHSRASQALSRVGLESKAGTLANTLSGGQQQRVAIARATATGSDVLLADEPTGNLDRENGQRILGQLAEIHEAGATVVVVTHSDDVAQRAQRVIRVEDGRIISDTGRSNTPPRNPRRNLTPADHRLRARDILSDAYRSVTSRYRSTTGLVLAVSIAVAFMILTIGLGASTSAQVSNTFNATTNREVTVSLPDQTGSQGTDIHDAVEHVRALAGVDAAVGIVEFGNVSAVTPATSAQVTLRGVVGDFEKAASVDIEWAYESTSSLPPGTALLGRSLAQQLQLSPLVSSPTVTVDGMPLTVIGLIKQSDRYPLLAGEIVTSIDTATQLARPTHTTIAITTANGAAPQVGRQAAVAIDPIAPETIIVNTPTDPSQLRQQVEWGVQIALTGFTILAAIVAVITLANAISMSVITRTGEFGLRRAVGARGSHLASLVSTEAALIGLGGGAAGLVIGLVALFGFTISQGWRPIFDINLAPLAVLTGMILAILSSALGSARAARLSPAAALRN